jgi:outer membrane receptor protein involved in Fe transport
VGERVTERGGVDGYDSLDLSLSAFHLGAKGLTVRASIKNALDDRVRYLLSLPTGTAVNIHDGRTWWLQLGYEL